MGIVFHFILICVNLLLLMNLMIALMSDTYATLSEFKKSLYFTNIIKAMPHYQYDPTYACLITICPPFNILVFMFVPYFILSKNNNNKKKLNRVLLMIIYSPIAIILAFFFTAFNLLMLPFAYFKILL